MILVLLSEKLCLHYLNLHVFSGMKINTEDSKYVLIYNIEVSIVSNWKLVYDF